MAQKNKNFAEMIGYLLMVGIQGTTLDSSTIDFLAEIRPNGVILFSRNVESPGQVAELNRDLQLLAQSMGIDPFFISVDQEGGRVRRLRKPFSEFPPSWEMAMSSEPETTVANFASQTAAELRLAGFNLDFVPVLDVVDENVELKSTVIGDRSFGSNPETVAHLGSVVIQQMRSQGIIPCAKHFPGHGATIVDSHFDLPVDERTTEELDNKDLIPFRKAIENHVEMTMTAHVLFPKLDPEYPATMSEKILDGMLRKRFGYDGVIITDDLDMGAVSKRYSTEICAIQSFRSGADVLLLCNSSEKALEALASLQAAYKDGLITSRQVSASINRIKSLKKKFIKSLQPCDPQRLLKNFSQRPTMA